MSYREVLLCIPAELQIALKDLSKVEYEGLSLKSREIIESYLKCYENGRLIIPTETIKDAKMSCDKYSDKTRATRLVPVLSVFLAIVSLFAAFPDISSNLYFVPLIIFGFAIFAFASWALIINGNIHRGKRYNAEKMSQSLNAELYRRHIIEYQISK